MERERRMGVHTCPHILCVYLHYSTNVKVIGKKSDICGPDRVAAFMTLHRLRFQRSKPIFQSIFRVIFLTIRADIAG